MNCDKIQSTLSEYVDGVLDAAAVVELEAHLEECADCRHELEMLRKAVSMLHELPEVQPPPDMLQRIRHELSGDGHGREPMTMTRFFLLPQTRLALAACLVLSVCIYGYRYLDLGKVDATRTDHASDEPMPAADPAVEDGLEIVLADQRMAPPRDKVQDVEERISRAKESDMMLMGGVKLESETPAPTVVARQSKKRAARPRAAAPPTAPAESLRRESGDIWTANSTTEKTEKTEKRANTVLMSDAMPATLSASDAAAKAGPESEGALSFNSPEPVIRSRMASRGVVVDSVAVDTDLAKDDAVVKAGAQQSTTARTNIVIASVATDNTVAVKDLMQEYSWRITNARADQLRKRSAIAGQAPANVIEVTVLQDKLPELVQKLRKLGMLTMKTWSTNRSEKTVTVRVTIEPAPKDRP